MFNNLNSSNNSARSSVDDIFAETDKAQEGGNSSNSNSASSGIETRKVGLTASDGPIEDADEKAAGNKWFKIILIVVIVAIVILSGYLVYSKFFKVSPELNNPPVSDQKTTNSTNSSSTPKSTGSFVATTSGEVATTTNPIDQPIIIPEIPGVNAPATTTTSSPVITDSNPTIDSDSDGLTDAEEKIAGTNINIIDTDNDGLSDYEEVKIYLTNSLVTDTDGDSYLDGAEVKGGYDPNGPGKLVKPVNSPKSSSVK